MRYEIYVPRLGKKETWLRLLLEADDWAAALQSGLRRIGEDGRAAESAVCEVHDGGVFLVREPASGRTFLLRQTEQAPQLAAGPLVAPRGRPAPEQAVADPREEALSLLPSSPGRPMAARVVEEEAEAKLPGALVRAATPLPVSRVQPPAQRSFDALAPKVQQELATLVDCGRDLQAAARKVLDLAMSHIPCESGSVLYTHVNRNDLYFAAARGPKSKEVLAFRVPIGRGIVGFCAAEGTCLAVNDVKHDPRFFSQISEAIGHEVFTIMAVPILTGGKVFGAIELINHVGGGSFDEDQLRLLSFIGYHMAEYLSTVIPG